MCRCIEMLQQGDLYARNIGLGEKDLEWYEHAVVEAAPIIQACRYAGILQQVLDRFGQSRMSRGWVSNVVSRFRKATVVVDQIRMLATGECDNFFFPVSADDYDRFGLTKCGGQMLQKIDHVVMTGVMQQWQRAASMWNEEHLAQGGRDVGVHGVPVSGKKNAKAA